MVSAESHFLPHLPGLPGGSYALKPTGLQFEAGKSHPCDLAG